MSGMLKKRKGREDENLVPIREQLVGNRYVKFSLNIPRSLHKEFKVRAFADERDMSDILLAAIDDYLNGRKE